MNEKLSKTLLLTLALGFSLGTTLPVSRDVGKDVEEKVPNLSYTTTSRAIFGPNVKPPTPADEKGNIHKWIGEAVDLMVKDGSAPLVIIAGDELP
jgi:hypothetical protein